jgi:hypothetical protein
MYTIYFVYIKNQDCFHFGRLIKSNTLTAFFFVGAGAHNKITIVNHRNSLDLAEPQLRSQVTIQYLY